MTVEILQAEPATDRARLALQGLANGAKAAGLSVRFTRRYSALGPWLLLWGPGAPDRAEAMRRHVRDGGRALALDLAYWSRDRKVRVSVDAPHPQAVVMARDLPETRLAADRPPTADAWDPAGPVVVAEIGRKAQVQYGAQVQDWEAHQVKLAAALGHEIVRRPKPRGPAEPIETALAGASAVVTWHSNVAVDAIRLGIPAVCQDGAAAAVCPPSLGLAAVPEPLGAAARDRFLGNLAWFQWDPAREGVAFWRFAQELLA
ncbi:MAG: hypothetical protein V4597_08620 [Pseudomonadota bacterium]